MRPPTCVLMWTAICLVAGTAQAATVTLKHGVNGPGTDDNFIVLGDPNANYGSADYMHLYVRSHDPEESGLIRFSLAGALPSGATVSSATLGLYIWQWMDLGNSENLLVSAHRINAARDWTETGSTWNQFKSGWYWSTPGAEWVPYDHLDPPDETREFFGSSPVNQYYTWNVTPSVQAWAGGAANNGWLMRPEHSAGSEGCSMWTRNHADLNVRPYLTITYTGSLAWTGSENGTWDTGTVNWIPNGGSAKTAYGNGDSVVFDSRGTGGTVTIPAAVLPASVTIVNSVALPYTLSGPISGGGGLLKLGDGTATLAGSLGNSYTGQTTVNWGSLILNKSSGNAVPANLVIGDGVGTDIVQLGNSNQIADTAAVTINSSGTLNLNGKSDAIGSLTLGGGTVSGSGTLTLGGNVSSSGTSSISGGGLALGTSRTFNVTSGTLTVGSTITGAGCALTKSGGGTMVLTSTSNSNSYSGGTNINGGIVQLNVDNQLPNNTPVSISSAALNFNGHNDTIGSLTLSGGAVYGAGLLTLGGNVTSSGSSALGGTQGPTLALGASRIFDVPSGTLTTASTITGAGCALTKTGNGTMIFGSAPNSNSYSGGTNINGGIVQLNVDNQLPNYSVSVSSAYLNFNGHNDTIGSLVLSGGSVVGAGWLTLGGNVTSSGNSALGGTQGPTLALGTSRTFDVPSGTLTLASTITGAGCALTKTGNGTMILSSTSNSNSYSGGTNINGGVVQLNVDNQLPDGTPVSVSSATLNLNGHNDTIGALTLSSGTVTGGGWLVLGGHLASSGTSSISGGTCSLGTTDRDFTVTSGTLTVSSAISGPGRGLSKKSGGTLIFSGTAPNTYTGTTNVEAGLLDLQKFAVGLPAVPGDLNISGGSVMVEWPGQIAPTSHVRIDPGATLRLNDCSETIGSLAGSGAVSLGAGSLTTGGNGDDTTFTGTITGAGALVKTGAGKMRLGGNSDYLGGTLVRGGILTVIADHACGTGTITLNGSATTALEIDSGVTIDQNVSLLSGTFCGNGTVLTDLVVGDRVTVAPGSTDPLLGSIGVLGTGNIIFQNRSTLEIELNGPGPAGIGYDQLKLNSDITLEDAELAVLLRYAPTLGESFTTVDNTGPNPVLGTFEGLHEGDTFVKSYGGVDYIFQISYQGGPGNNDIVLDVVPEPGSIALLLGALAALVMWRSRRTR